MDAVSDVLQAREQRRETLTPMVVVSAAAHVAVFVVFALISLRAATAPPPKVFMVSWAGSEGPRTGGANAMGGRPVEEVAPPQPTKKSPEPPPPPTPKMTVPEERPTRKPRPESIVARVAPPTVKPPLTGGEEVRPGSTKVDTPARGNGFGLSSGGSPSSGVSLDVTDFCCMDYIQKVADRIKSNWKGEQGRPGKVVVKFTIHRDGSLDGADVEQSSGFAPLDFEARRALQLTSRVERLPAQFNGDQLTVHLTFTYER
jgi:protein TonB